MDESSKQIIMDSDQMRETLERLSKEIMAQVADRNNLVFVGIHTGECI